MDVLTWIVSLIATTYLGYYLRTISNAINDIRESLKVKVDKKQPEPDNKSIVIDPDDVLQMAKFEQEETFKRLNPDA